MKGVASGAGPEPLAPWGRGRSLKGVASRAGPEPLAPWGRGKEGYRFMTWLTKNRGEPRGGPAVMRDGWNDDAGK